MNKLQTLQTRNKIRQLIRISNRHKNVLRWSSNETNEHIQRKLDICKYFKKNNIEFMTEAVFHNGLRCDILVCDEERIVEILNTESEESILRKKKVYPLPVVFIDANKEFDERMCN